MPLPSAHVLAPAGLAPAVQALIEMLVLAALLSAAYGTVMRHARRQALGRAMAGVLFGCGAVIAMDRASALGSEAVADLGSLPLLLAGAFLGGRGAGAAMALAAAVRWTHGGEGLPADLAGLLLAGGLGLLWARLEGPGLQGLPALLRLAAVSTVLLPAALPPDPDPWAARAWPALALLWIGIAVSGALLERERRFLAHVGRLSREGEEDALTGLLNRRGFVRAVARARAARPEGRRGAPTGGDTGRETEGGAVILIDIDHFKRVNDRHGHPAGDAVLQALGPRLRQVLRPGDIVARLGGEEIAVFLPATAAATAETTAHRLCEAVRRERFPAVGGPGVAITASIGGAWAGTGATSLDTLLARADAALYEAKAAGRDRSRFAPFGSDCRPAGPALGRVGPDPEEAGGSDRPSRAWAEASAA